MEIAGKGNAKSGPDHYGFSEPRGFSSHVPARQTVRHEHARIPMMQVIAPVGALLGSVALLLMGNGLQGTLLPLRADLEAFGPVAIGVMGSSYFLGFALGCLDRQSTGLNSRH